MYYRVEITNNESVRVFGFDVYDTSPEKLAEILEFAAAYLRKKVEDKNKKQRSV